MEDAARFDPIAGLSPRVISRLKDAPELDLDEDQLPQPGEKLRVWYPPDSFDALARQDFRLQNEVVEVVQWYRRSKDTGIVALIYRETRRSQAVSVLFGDDWAVDEERAVNVALALVQDACDRMLLQLSELGEQRNALEKRRDEAVQQRAAVAAERVKALEEGKLVIILLVHRADETGDEKYVVDQARKRGLELMADKRVSIAVADDSVADEATLDAVPKGAGGLLLIEHMLGEGDMAYPAITAAQAKLIDTFLELGKPVWVWRASQGLAVAGHNSTKALDPELESEPAVVAVLQ